MKNYAIALGFKGKLYNNIIRAWKIFEKSVGIKYISTFHTQPHIVIIAGKTKNIEKLVSKSKNTSIEDKKLQGKVTNTFVKGKELFKL